MQKKTDGRGQDPSAEWQAERQQLLHHIEALEQEYGKQDHLVGQLRDSNASLQNQLADYHSSCNELKQDNDAQHMQIHDLQAQLEAKVQATEKEKYELQEQLAKMSEIISQLNKKGLPLPPDDSYISQAFNSLIAETRQWVRNFTKGLPPLTTEVLQAAIHGFSDEMVSHLNDSFLDLMGLVNSTSVGTKARTRCVEALLLRTFTGSYLTDCYIGFDHTLYAKCQDIFGSFGGSSGEQASGKICTLCLQYLAV